jgi:hypothetical protein
MNIALMVTGNKPKKLSRRINCHVRNIKAIHFQRFARILAEVNNDCINRMLYAIFCHAREKAASIQFT